MSEVLVQFIIGFVVYAALATASYSATLKASSYYYLFGICAAIVANLCWLHIARNESNSSKLVMTGLYWDIMLTMTYIIVPFTFFGARATIWQGLGILAIIGGIILTKVG